MEHINTIDNTPWHCHDCCVMPICRVAQHAFIDSEPKQGKFSEWDGSFTCNDCIELIGSDEDCYGAVVDVALPLRCDCCNKPIECKLSSYGEQHMRGLVRGTHTSSIPVSSLDYCLKDQYRKLYGDTIDFDDKCNDYTKQSCWDYKARRFKKRREMLDDGDDYPPLFNIRGISAQAECPPSIADIHKAYSDMRADREPPPSSTPLEDIARVQRNILEDIERDLEQASRAVIYDEEMEGYEREEDCEEEDY